MKTARTYRFNQTTLDSIEAISEHKHISATEAVERAMAAYAGSFTVDSETAEQADGGTLAAIDALTSQISVKDAQISALTVQLSETTAALRASQDSLKAAQALHAADVKRLEKSEAARRTDSESADSWKSKGLLARILKR